MNRLISLLALMFLAAEPAFAADSLCNIINRFAAAPQRADEAKNRRWIEFHWGFDHSADSFWSWGCRHSDQPIAKQTCAWLRDNTNQEFTMMLPQEIMSCYDYRFPKHAAYDWQRIAGTIRLRGHDGRYLVLDLDYRDLPKGEVAIRLAVEMDGVQYEPDELPAIEAMPGPKPK